MTDKYAFEQARISATSMRIARNQLREFGYIAFDREQGGAYTYTHCDPKTGKPFPGDPKAKPNAHRLVVQGTAKDVASVSPPEGGRPPNEPIQFLSSGARNYFPNGVGGGNVGAPNDVDTSFDFGANLQA